jgi:uracil-DNA glycosylase family 4
MDEIKRINILEEKITNCRLCPRLVAWREEVARQKRRAYLSWDYWGRPVPGFGDINGRVMVIGLAPGAHGSNRTGRMFTGDASGDFLYPALFRAGFASQPRSMFVNDDLNLHDLFITAVCRCAPPGNKPAGIEMDTCQPYLESEISLIQPLVYVALGRIAFERIVRLHSLQHERMVFCHGKTYSLGEHLTLVCSYHPSRQNTQTGRLTLEMFDQIWSTVRKLL